MRTDHTIAAASAIDPELFATTWRGQGNRPVLQRAAPGLPGYHGVVGAEEKVARKETEAEKFYFPDDAPLFSPGQIVRHRRYGYRGVIVDFDMCCRASDEWYRANRTQPPRDQPWYHVMVDGSTSITYAAQDSLVADDAPRPVHHPLVQQFFDGISRGRYQRNDEIWPGWD